LRVESPVAPFHREGRLAGQSGEQVKGLFCDLEPFARGREMNDADRSAGGTEGYRQYGGGESDGTEKLSQW
jgi:hypothetical protein